MTITYLDTAQGLDEGHVGGLFSHWGTPPAAPDILRIFRGSDYLIVAFDDEKGYVIGYITAISDGVSAAYIPHLEVREEWRKRGIGQALVERMAAKLRHLYMIDLICDADLVPFYEKAGFQPWQGMLIRNRERQRCDEGYLRL